MTLEQFITKYSGKKVEYHSYNPNALYQCTDLANQWIVEGLGLKAIIGTNAQDFPSKKGTQFDYILNTPDGLPKAGDLMIFSSADKVGHISIFVEGNLSTFKSFDQNYPTGSACKIVSHNYKNVLGWLRAKQPTVQSTQESMNETKVLTYYNVKTEDELIKMVDEQISFLSDARKEIGAYQQKIKDNDIFVMDLLSILKPINKYAGLSDMDIVKAELKELIKSKDGVVAEFKKASIEWEQKERELKKENEDLKSQIESMKIQLATMKRTHSEEIALFEKRLGQLESNVTQVEEKKDDFEAFTKLVLSIKKLIGGFKWQKK